MNIQNVIKKPVVTEKSSLLKEVTQSYVFEVDKRADKKLIKKSIEELFNVKVRSVNTLIQRGKVKKFGKGSGRTRCWKKAVVSLAEGKIEIFEGV
ncbi:MAG: 50S ribosomal protein L23 [Deltaproteobacteria bacterium]|nr:50S ribosomal protein L23 [Deltaproteobacteria bacterium]